MTATAAARPGRRSLARLAIWSFHLALPLAGLWLLLAVPAADVRWEHHPTHFWLVAGAGAVSMGLAAAVDRTARRRGDTRLLLVGLGFLVAAMFLLLHALATPGVLLGASNGGFELATPVGLTLCAVFFATSSFEPEADPVDRVARVASRMRITVLAIGAVWGTISLAGLPPLADPAIAARGTGIVVGLAVVAVPLFLVAAVRYFLLYRRRRSVLLLSTLTADVLLGEATVAVTLGSNWHVTWWLWHVLMALAFAYVAYSAWVTYQREGGTRGLFEAIGTDQTVAALRAEYGSALETLVDAVARQEAGELSPGEMSMITDGLAARFGLSGGQTAVLGRAAAALRAEREQLARLGVLVAIGNESRVRLGEQRLLARAVRLVGQGFGGDGVRVGLLDDGRLSFAAPLSTDPGWMLPDDVVRGLGARLGSGQEPIAIGPDVLAFPLSVTDRPTGVLLARRRAGFTERDRSLLASLAGQLSLGLENTRLFHEIDGLFRQYMSPAVATALLADPGQAALGGAVVEVTAFFADLGGFTAFSERSTPAQVVAMLNRFFGTATAVILAEGGTVVQFVGDALMALFNAPVRQPDHAARAVRAALAMQREIDRVAEPGWPRFRIGINTGPALVGNIGSTLLRNFNAMGDAVNVAARLESAAAPGQVVIGESTRAMLPVATATSPLGALTVKGRAAPVVAYLLQPPSV